MNKLANKIASLTHKVFYDNKVLMVFSFVFAVLIWLVVAIALSPIDTAVIKDVPVEINLTNSLPAQFDLQIFGQSEFTVDVEVSGKRYIVNSASVNKDSVKVVAQTGYVDSAGKHRLLLKVTKANENDEFEIISVSEQQIEVFFDVYKELAMPIEPRVIGKENLAKNGFIAGDPIISADTVTVSGPATEIDSIKKVYAEMEVERPLDVTTTQPAEIKAYNENEGVLHYITFNYGNSEITITLPIYYLVDKPTSIDFKNTPLAYIEKGFEYSVSPATLKAGIQGVDKNTAPATVSIAAIDFAHLKPGKNTFTVNADEIPSVYIVDDTKSFTVTVDVKNCSTKTLVIPEENVNFVNVPEGFEVSGIEKPIGSVTVVGPASSLEKIRAADIVANVDLKDIDIAAKNQSVGAKLSVINRNDCWVSGEYKVVLK